MNLRYLHGIYATTLLKVSARGEAGYYIVYQKVTARAQGPGVKVIILSTRRSPQGPRGDGYYIVYKEVTARAQGPGVKQVIILSTRRSPQGPRAQG